MPIQSRTSLWLLTTLAGIAIGVGCDIQPDDDNGSGGGTGGGGCQSDNDCRGDRICEEGECVDPEDEDEDDGDDDDADGDDGADDGPSPGPGPGPGPGDDGGDDPPSNSCSGDETQCSGSSSMSFCDEGQWATYSCDEVCSVIGFTGASCSDDFCGCGEPLSPDCYLGVSAFCTCLESTGDSCDQTAFSNMYIACFEGEAPEFACFADYVYDNTVYCADAVEACL